LRNSFLVLLIEEDMLVIAQLELLYPVVN
jgi:hypothetical protein